MHSGVNRLGCFALTGLLLERLPAAPGARVVAVAGMVHLLSNTDLSDSEPSERGGARRCRPMAAHAASKTAGLLFVRELATGPPARASIRPSPPILPLATCEVGRTPGCAARRGARRLARPTAGVAGASPDQRAGAGAGRGHPPYVHGDSCSGPRLLGVRGGPGAAPRAPWARNDIAAAQLWALSERLTGVMYPGCGGTVPAARAHRRPHPAAVRPVRARAAGVTGILACGPGAVHGSLACAAVRRCGRLLPGRGAVGPFAVRKPRAGADGPGPSRTLRTPPEPHVHARTHARARRPRRREEAAVIRVLVVDDDFMVARLHSTLVGQVPGFTVAGAAHSGAEALTAVQELRPDLVLLDMYLPDLPGLEVLRELRGTAAPEEGPDVLVITAARDAETVRGARRGGAVQYIIKPFEGELLKERLLRYAERRKALEALQAPEQGDVDRLFADADDPGPDSGSGSAATARPGSADGSRPSPDGDREAAAPGPYRATTGTGARLPKGLTEQTAALVRSTLEAESGPGGLSASECAVHSGLSRVSARRYLEHFVSLGTARVTLRYGTTGRPERRYHPVHGQPPESHRTAGEIRGET